MRPPTALVYIRVPASEVDVNVHPQKLEVRFAKSASVHRAVTEAVAEATGAFLRAEAQRLHQGAPLSERGGMGLRPEQGAPPVYGGKLGQKAFPGATSTAWRPGRAAHSGSPGPYGAPRAHHAALLPSSEPQALEPTSDVVPSLPGLAPKPDPYALWQQLVPLGVAPAGHLCCRLGDELALVHLVAAQRVVLLAALAAQVGPCPAEALMMPPTWVPEDALAAAADDYVIETAQRPSPWGVTLEAVGPGHYVVMAVPAAFAAFNPVRVAQCLIESLRAAQVPCHEGFLHKRAALSGSWADGVLLDWPGPGQGGAQVWGPSFLQRLAQACVPPQGPVLTRLCSQDLMRLSRAL